jgi:hypothetical protein
MIADLFFDSELQWFISETSVVDVFQHPGFIMLNDLAGISSATTCQLTR